jgi:hypothetical protein
VPGEPDTVLLIEDDPRAAMLIGAMLRATWDEGLVFAHAERFADGPQELIDRGATCVLISLSSGGAERRSWPELTVSVNLSPRQLEDTGSRGCSRRRSTAPARRRRRCASRFPTGRSRAMPTRRSARSRD